MWVPFLPSLSLTLLESPSSSQLIVFSRGALANDQWVPASRLRFIRILDIFNNLSGCRELGLVLWLDISADACLAEPVDGIPYDTRYTGKVLRQSEIKAILPQPWSGRASHKIGETSSHIRGKDTWNPVVSLREGTLLASSLLPSRSSSLADVIILVLTPTRNPAPFLWISSSSNRSHPSRKN